MPSHFRYYPKILYDINKDGNKKIAVDILKRIAIREGLKEELSLFKEYSVEDSETPEVVSQKFYGTPDLHWLILMTNDILHPQFDWPISTRSLDTLIEKEYPGVGYFIEPVFTGGISGQGYFERDYQVNEINNEYNRALVHRWDASLRRLEVYGHTSDIGNSSVFAIGMTVETFNANGVQVTGVVSRVVNINGDSLHHIEDNDNKLLDSFSTPPVGDNKLQVFVGQTGDAFPTTAVTFGQTVLHTYLTSGDGDVSTHQYITNRNHKINENEDRRSIKIIKQEFVTRVVSEFKRLISQ